MKQILKNNYVWIKFSKHTRLELSDFEMYFEGIALSCLCFTCHENIKYFINHS